MFVQASFRITSNLKARGHEGNGCRARLQLPCSCCGQLDTSCSVSIAACVVDTFLSAVVTRAIHGWGLEGHLFRPCGEAWTCKGHHSHALSTLI